MDLSPTNLQFLGRLKPPENAWKPKKEVKVVLITLPSPWLISDRDMPNLGVLYVAAYLRDNGINTQVVDYCGVPVEHWYVPEGDIYGISCTTPQYPLAKLIVGKIRDQHPEGYIVMGGYHPSALPEFTLEDAKPDCVVVGDGEYTMLDIARGLRTPKIDGTRVESLDVMPWPARDMIAIRDYQRIGTNAVVGKGALREEYVLQSRG
jgi:anaerobic magnesium-protoporphyrin IX monomethyl ester cyclase